MLEEDLDDRGVVNVHSLAWNPSPVALALIHIVVVLMFLALLVLLLSFLPLVLHLF